MRTGHLCSILVKGRFAVDARFLCSFLTRLVNIAQRALQYDTCELLRSSQGVFGSDSLEVESSIDLLFLMNDQYDSAPKTENTSSGHLYRPFGRNPCISNRQAQSEIHLNVLQVSCWDEKRFLFRRVSSMKAA